MDYADKRLAISTAVFKYTAILAILWFLISWTATGTAKVCIEDPAACAKIAGGK